MAVAAPVTAAPVAAAGEDLLHVKIRTLQGLLLKHRGGPGFGAGRLKSPEAQQLEDTLKEVTGTLRQETGVLDVKPMTPLVAAVQPVAVAPSAAVKPIAEALPSPPPQPVTATTVAPAPQLSQQPPPATADSLAASLALVEAALQSYKESPSADRKKTVMSLSKALMFAIGASNKHIAEGELQAHRAAMEAGPQSVATAASATNVAGAQQPMTGFPTTYAITRPEEESESTTATTQSDAAASIIATHNPALVVDRLDNENKLEEVYNALVRTAGEGGKFGLKNISEDEANELADKLVNMRSILLDELNNGI